MKYTAKCFLILVCALSLLTACSSSKKDWNTKEMGNVAKPDFVITEMTQTKRISTVKFKDFSEAAITSFIASLTQNQFNVASMTDSGKDAYSYYTEDSAGNSYHMIYDKTAKTGTLVYTLQATKADEIVVRDLGYMVLTRFGSDPNFTSGKDEMLVHYYLSVFFGLSDMKTPISKMVLKNVRALTMPAKGNVAINLQKTPSTGNFIPIENSGAIITWNQGTDFIGNSILLSVDIKKIAEFIYIPDESADPLYWVAKAGVTPDTVKMTLAFTIELTLGKDIYSKDYVITFSNGSFNDENKVRTDITTAHSFIKN